MPRKLCLAVSALLLLAAHASAAPKVVALHTQRVGNVTYFHVRLQAPPDLDLPSLTWWEKVPDNLNARRAWLRLPRLVPQDKHTTAVCYEIPRPLEPGAVRHLDFVGQVQGKEAAALLLVYPTGKAVERADRTPLLAPAPLAWQEVAVKVDFGEAKAIDPPRAERYRERSPKDEDLQGRWAIARAREFAIQELQNPEAGFFGLAREALCRKYEVRIAPLELDTAAPEQQQEHRRLYEMATGSTALTESLALRRLLNSRPEEGDRRTIDVGTVAGIDIAEHPWERMMGDKKPAPEPLAGLVPHEHYYVTFRTARGLVRFADLLDEWGGNLLNSWELSSRDSQLRQRYERQLCLDSAALARDLDPDLLRGIALTGSDPYLREGSDVTVLFHVTNPRAFLQELQPFLDRAKDEQGSRLRYKKTRVGGVAVENYVTQGREVSLHQAVVGDFVICSNSAAALERVLDTRAGKRKALADALDFQYMRTVFARSAEDEDGFAYLSDAFIRNLVGPASKIKEKRRLEALASLRLVTHGALFAALETGRLPRDQRELLQESRLKPEEIYAPEGKLLAWDGTRREAVSDAYGTLRFATPLIELPIDKVTPREAADYATFRAQYLGLWRRYFDPVGMRVRLGAREVRLETYILPLVQNNSYNESRVLTAGGTTRLDLSAISPRTLFQFAAHIAPQHRRLTTAFNLEKPALGDGLQVRLDDSPLFWKMAELRVRRELGLLKEEEWRLEEGRLLFQLPFTFGIKVGDQEAFDKLLATVETFGFQAFGQTDQETFRYRGTSIKRVRFLPGSQVAEWVSGPNVPEERRCITPEIFYAQVDGVFYAGFRKEVLHELIDRAARREGLERGKDGPEVNSSVYLAPKAVSSARAAVQGYLEWESNRRALANAPLWDTLFRSGAVSTRAEPAALHETALRTFGFVPISPEGAPYHYDRRRGEVVNERHGSLTRPTLRPRLADNAPLARLLRQFPTLRADLRFREDGVHTTVTIGLEEKGR